MMHGLKMAIGRAMARKNLDNMEVIVGEEEEEALKVI